MRIIRALAITGALCAAQAGTAADAPEPYPDFTFRRVAPPEGAAQRRITVQIDPEEQARLLAARPVAPRPLPPDAEGDSPAGPTARAPARHGWFWEIVSPGIAARNGRYLDAVAAISSPPEGQGVDAPRLQHMQDIARLHGPAILRASVGTQVSPALVLAVIAVESSGRTDAISSAGAQGLMQLIPATAERFGVDDAMDAPQNIAGGVAYLDWLMRLFENDVVLALAGYNAGENAVRNHGGVPPFAETRDYVPKVLAAWLVARGLCTTPPELVSDGCVFRVGAAG